MKLDTEHEITYEIDPLLRLALDNNREALDELFARYRSHLYGRALLLLGNPEDAEDALQDGLLSAFRNLHRFKGRSKFSSWLTRIVINAALMQLRRRRSRVMSSMDDQLKEDGQDWAITFPDPGLNPEEVCAQRERLETLRRGVRGLTARYQRVLWLREIQGLTTREAAEALGLSQGTLKSQLTRARSKLKKGVTGPPAQTLIQESCGNVWTTGHPPSAQSAGRPLLPAA